MAILKQYKSHKIVQAARIIDCVWNSTINLETEKGPITYTPTPEFWNRIKRNGEAQPPIGWLVRYRDGFESWSPQKEFIDGYKEVKSKEVEISATAKEWEIVKNLVIEAMGNGNWDSDEEIAAVEGFLLTLKQIGVE